jgi:RNA recognition motif-containing protein
MIYNVKHVLHASFWLIQSNLTLNHRKIFIGGLSYSTDDDKLRKYFGVYGSVQDAVVMKDPVSRRSRGFGFITFTDINAVDNALAHEPHTIDARKVSWYMWISMYMSTYI